jgi:hypothetical protein
VIIPAQVFFLPLVPFRSKLSLNPNIGSMIIRDH